MGYLEGRRDEKRWRLHGGRMRRGRCCGDWRWREREGESLRMAGRNGQTVSPLWAEDVVIALVLVWGNSV